MFIDPRVQEQRRRNRDAVLWFIIVTLSFVCLIVWTAVAVKE